MASPGVLLKNVTDMYQDLMNNKYDPRTQDWFLVREPWPVMCIVAVYLFIVWRGPKLMEHRKAFSLQTVLVVYNLFLVVLSAYMCWELFATTLLRPRAEFSLACAPVDYSDDPQSVRLASVIWLYSISKVVEMLDTIFFILRKKNNQLSFLHVYHHSSLLLYSWSGVKFVPGGEVGFPCMFNCFVHVLMYTYYCVAVMGPRYQKYIWWKKYMTSLQLIQFVSMMAKTIYAMYVNCGFPLFYLYLQTAYSLSLFGLFINFYRKAYKLRAGKAVSGSNKEAVSENGKAVSNGLSNGVSHLHAD